MKKLFQLFIATLISISGISAQQSISIQSPDKQVNLSVSTLNNQVFYQLSFKGKIVIEPSLLGFVLNKPALKLNQFKLIAIDSTEHDDTWQPVWGEVSQIRNHYRQLKLNLENPSGIRLNVIFRIFNEGLGFRYEFPTQANLKHFVVGDELTQFNLTANHKTFWIPGDYDSNEYLYNTTKLSEIDAIAAANREPDIAVKSVIGINAVQSPLMMKTAEGLYINIHEAALLNYPAMNLVLDKKTFTLSTHLVPDAVGNKAYLQTPAQTPWRVVNVSDKAAELLDSKMILNLNEPSKIENTTWIKPQKFVGMWWEMHVGKATWEKSSGKHGANTQNVKTYIDFASKHGFDGVLVEGWNEGWEDWFGNWKENVFDFTTPYADYNIDSLSHYAQQKGVKLIMHHETSGAVTNYERRMDAAYQFMQKQGINTVKTGYVGKIIPRGEHHDGQWMVSHYERVAQKTADYHIMLAAHEPVHPTGLHRTYPNWLANEAARGGEFNNAPTLGIPPEHTTILPFTRLMGGPMDFTPGLFHFQLNQFDASRKQRVRSTLAKQLALYITMYSPLQMAADLPENYNKHLDAFQFIKDVPVNWDNTKILEAEPGDYLTIARQEKGKNNWFIGSITDENSRESRISFNFLAEGNYQATIYKDGEKADCEVNPEAYQIEKQIVTNKTLLTIKLAKGGGYAISLIKL